jgi:hypothetical protein
MAGKPVGTMFAEINLDSTKMEQGLKRVHDSLVQGTIKVEDAYKQLGIKSDQTYTMMRENASKTLDFIKNKTLSSKDEILRAETAFKQKISQLDKEQYAQRVTFMDKVKSNWIAASVAITAAWVATNKAMSYMEEGAKAMRIESSFNIVAEQSGVMADILIENMTRATKGTIDNSDLMQKATKLMLKGFDAEQIERFSKVVGTAARYGAISVNEAFDRLGDAIANRMPRSMVQLGALTRTQFKLIEQAVKEGMDDIELFNLAIANLTVQQLKQKGTQDEATVAIQQFHAQVKEAGEWLGTVLIRILQTVWGAFQMLASVILGVTSVVYGFIASLSQLAEWGARKLGLTGIAESFKGIADTMKEESSRVGQEAENLAKESANNMKGTADVGVKASKDEISAAEKVVKSLIDKAKAYVETAKNAKAGAKELEKFNDLMRTLQYEKSVAETFGLDELKKKLIENEAWAAKLKDTMKGQPKDRRDKANALIDEIKLLKDFQAEWESWRKAEDKAEEELQKAADKEVDEMKKIQDAYEGIRRSVDPLYDSQKKLAESLEDIQRFSNTFPALAESVQPVIDALKSQYDATRLGEAASYYEGITGYENVWYSLKMKHIEAIRKAEILAGKDAQAANKKAEDSIQKINTETFKGKMDSIGQMTEGGVRMFTTFANLYDEDSKKHKEMDAIATAFAIAEQARLGTLALYNAVVGIAGQAQGDPYSAFARIAAMMAVMASLLSIIGMGMGGSSGGSVGGTTTTPEPYVPSTVLAGESGEASESIVNALETLGDVNSSEYRELVGIHDNMVELNSNLTGMTRTLLQATDKGQLKTNMVIGDISIDDIMAGMNVEGIFSKMGKNKAIGEFLAGLGTPLDNDITRFVTQIYKGISTGLVEIGKILGVDAKTIMEYQFQLQTLKLKGVKREDVEEAIMAWASKVADVAAGDLFGEIIKQYQELDEGLFETAMRIAMDKVIIEDSLEMVGQSFTGTIAQLIEFAEWMIKMAGDLEALQGYFQSFFEKFMTEEQQQVFLTGKLTELLAVQGITLPKTRQGYADLAASLDLNTKAGQEAYFVLMQLADTADEYYSYLEELAQEALETAEDNLNKAFDAEKERRRASYDAEIEALNKAYEAKVKLTNDAYNEQLKLMTDRLSDAKESVNDLSSSIDDLESAKQDLLATDDILIKYTQEQAKSQLSSMIGQARAGNFAGLKDGLENIVDVLTDTDNTQYKTRNDYLRAQMQVYNQFEELQSLTEDELTDSEKTVDLLTKANEEFKTAHQQELDTLKALHDDQKNYLTEQYNAEVKMLDAQLNAVLGIDTNVLSIAQAIEEYNRARDVVNPPTPEIPLPIIPPTPPPPEPMDRATALLTQYGHANPSDLELEWINQMIAGGRDDAYIIERLKSHPGRFAGGGYHAGGMRLVGEYGPELEYTGPSLIYSNSKTKSMLSNEELVAEVRQLRQELNSVNLQVVRNTAKTAKLLDRWDGDGMPDVRTA